MSWVTITVEIAVRALEPLQRRLDRVTGLLVEGGGRLVEQEHPGLQREGPGQHHPLLLADRELRRITVLEPGVQPGELEAAPASKLWPARRGP